MKLYDFLVGGLERELIEEVMRQYGNTQVKAAERLGINRNTLHKKLEQFKEDDRPPGEAAELAGFVGEASEGHGAA